MTLAIGRYEELDWSARNDFAKLQIVIDGKNVENAEQCSSRRECMPQIGLNKKKPIIDWMRLSAA